MRGRKRVGSVGRRVRQISSSAAIVVATSAATSWGTTYYWQGTGGTAEWTNPANWSIDPASYSSNGSYPDQPDDLADAQWNNLTSALILDINQPVTTGLLQLGSNYPTTVQASGSGSITLAGGPDTTLGNGAGSASLVDNFRPFYAPYDDSISVNLYLASPLGIHGEGSTFTISSNISDAPGTSGNPITVYGSASLGPGVVLSGNNTFTGAMKIIDGAVVLVGQGTGWGQSAGVTVEDASALKFKNSTPVRATPITLNGGMLLSVPVDSGSVPAASVVSSPITVTAPSFIGTENETSYGTDYGATLTLTGPISSDNYGLTIADFDPAYGASAPRSVTISGNVDLGTGALTVGGIYTLVNGLSAEEVVADIESESATFGNLTLNGASRLTISGNADFGTFYCKGSALITGTATCGAASIDGGTLQIGSGGANGTLTIPSVTFSNNGQLIFDRSDAITASALISGAGGITQQGTGTLTLTGANSFTGKTEVDAGTLTVGPNSAIGSGPLVVQNLNSGTGTVGTATVLNLNGNPTSVASLSGSVASPQTGTNTATINLNGSALTVNQTTAATFAGDIAGSGSFTKNGSATLVLTGNNTFSGPTNLSAGTLQIGAGGTTGSLAGPVNTSSGTTLIFDRSNALTVAGPITGAGGVTQEGTGTLTLKQANSYSGQTYISAGTVAVENTSGSATGSGPVTVVSGATLTGNGAISGGVIIGSWGTLSPGTGLAGILSLGSSLGFSPNSALKIGLSGTGSNEVVVDGQLNLGGNMDVELLDGYTPTLGATFTIMENESALSNDGAFSNLVNNELTVDGKYVFAVDSTSNVDGGSVPNDVTLSVVAVPEPAGSIWVGLSLVPMLVRRRDRGRRAKHC